MRKITAFLTICLFAYMAVMPVQAQNEVASQQSFKEIVARISTKVDFKLENYENFLAKVESRRNVFSEAGTDVSTLDSQLRLIRQQLRETQVQADNSMRTLESLDLTNFDEAQQDALVEIRNLKTNFSELHQDIREVVRVAKLLDTTN